MLKLSVRSNLGGSTFQVGLGGRLEGQFLVQVLPAFANFRCFFSFWALLRYLKVPFGKYFFIFFSRVLEGKSQFTIVEKALHSRVSSVRLLNDCILLGKKRSTLSPVTCPHSKASLKQQRCPGQSPVINKYHYVTNKQTPNKHLSLCHLQQTLQQTNVLGIPRSRSLPNKHWRTEVSSLQLPVVFGSSPKSETSGRSVFGSLLLLSNLSKPPVVQRFLRILHCLLQEYPIIPLALDSCPLNGWDTWGWPSIRILGVKKVFWKKHGEDWTKSVWACFGGCFLLFLFVFAYSDVSLGLVFLDIIFRLVSSFLLFGLWVLFIQIVPFRVKESQKLLGPENYPHSTSICTNCCGSFHPTPMKNPQTARLLSDMMFSLYGFSEGGGECLFLGRGSIVHALWLLGGQKPAR